MESELLSVTYIHQNKLVIVVEGIAGVVQSADAVARLSDSGKARVMSVQQNRPRTVSLQQYNGGDAVVVGVGNDVTPLPPTSSSHWSRWFAYELVQYVRHSDSSQLDGIAVTQTYIMAPKNRHTFSTP